MTKFDYQDFENDIDRIIKQLAVEIKDGTEINEIKHWVSFIELNIALHYTNEIITEQEAIMLMVRLSRVKVLHKAVKDYMRL